MKMLLLPILLLAVVEAKLVFDSTVLYDMFDFKGTYDYPITTCAQGCRVYLTYPNDDCPRNPCLGDQDNGPFTIQLPNGGKQIKFIDLNNLRLDNGEKGYFDIPEGTAQFIIHNPNGNGVARPLALWVVPYDTPFLRHTEVYEAGEATTIKTSTNRIVLMSVSPFTISGTVEGEYELFVKTSPIEMMNNDECDYVLDIGSTISQTFSVPVNSPLISLGFNSGGFTATLKTDHTFSFFRSIETSGYLTGPGYIGCKNKTHVFRSESYNSNSGVSSSVSGDKKRHVSFYGDLETDSTAPIELIDLDTGKDLKLVGNEATKTNIWTYELDTSSFAIIWDNSMWRNETFMIRYVIDLPKVSPMPTKTTPKASGR